jgi:hypothetical protein
MIFFAISKKGLIFATINNKIVIRYLYGKSI